MKKTLIALAAVAATGAVMAQSTVTLSGKLRFAYESAKSEVTATPDVKTSGLRVTDGDFVMTAVEDLGGGMKMTASMAVLSRGRTTAIAGRDASLTLSGGFGSVMVGAVESGNGIIGLGGVGAPVYGMDGSVIAGASNVDMLRYTTPDLFPGFKAYVSLIDGVGLAGAGTGGMEAGSTTSQDASQIGATYVDGPVAIAADYTAFGRNSVAGNVPDDRMRLSASYDLGVAKLGFGYESRDTTAAANNNTKDTIVGVSVPMGALTFGLNYARSKTEGGVAVKGFDLGVKYDLSKRTYIAAAYQSVDNASYDATLATRTTGAGREFSKYRIQLAHSF